MTAKKLFREFARLGRLIDMTADESSLAALFAARSIVYRALPVNAQKWINS
jgi:hypothetical protein